MCALATVQRTIIIMLWAEHVAEWDQSGTKYNIYYIEKSQLVWTNYLHGIIIVFMEFIILYLIILLLLYLYRYRYLLILYSYKL